MSTAGIGQNAVAVCRRVCQDAARIGVSLNRAGNEAGNPASRAGPFGLYGVVPTDEDLMIACHTWDLVSQ